MRPFYGLNGLNFTYIDFFHNISDMILWNMFCITCQEVIFFCGWTWLHAYFKEAGPCGLSPAKHTMLCSCYYWTLGHYSFQMSPSSAWILKPISHQSTHKAPEYKSSHIHNLLSLLHNNPVCKLSSTPSEWWWWRWGTEQEVKRDLRAPATHRLTPRSPHLPTQRHPSALPGCTVALCPGSCPGCDAVTGRVTLCVWPRACMLDVVIINALLSPLRRAVPEAGGTGGLWRGSRPGEQLCG